jgi:hypothetical protein
LLAADFDAAEARPTDAEGSRFEITLSENGAS